MHLSEKVLHIAKLCEIKSTLSQINNEDWNYRILLLIKIRLYFGCPVSVFYTWQVDYIQIGPLHDRACSIRQEYSNFFHGAHFGAQFISRLEGADYLDHILYIPVSVLHIGHCFIYGQRLLAWYRLWVFAGLTLSFLSCLQGLLFFRIFQLKSMYGVHIRILIGWELIRQREPNMPMESCLSSFTSIQKMISHDIIE